MELTQVRENIDQIQTAAEARTACAEILNNFGAMDENLFIRIKTLQEAAEEVTPPEAKAQIVQLMKEYLRFEVED
jgi:hypothetical protein